MGELGAEKTNSFSSNYHTPSKNKNKKKLLTTVQEQRLFPSCRVKFKILTLAENLSPNQKQHAVESDLSARCHVRPQAANICGVTNLEFGCYN